MPEPNSIKQDNIPAEGVPDFRNLGVILRIVVIVNALALFIALAQAYSFQDMWQHVLHGSAFIQPTLLAILLILNVLNNLLLHMSYARGAAVVLLVAATTAGVVANFVDALYEPFAADAQFDMLRLSFLGLVVAGLVLWYFRLRSQSLAPAISGARLQALQARIRPHFLFNSINAVLGIVRSNPRQAEVALEDMADLFRMAMTDNRELVPIMREVDLSKQYLALEQLRLGERLKVDWQISELPADALIPPLILQPLLENAVYHGIEPMHDGGLIAIKLYRQGREIHIDVLNPRLSQVSRHAGSKLALANIRERLALQFDLEARYAVEEGEKYYHVHIQLPYATEERR